MIGHVRSFSYYSDETRLNPGLIVHGDVAMCPAARQYPGVAVFDTSGLSRHMGDPIRVISEERVLLLSEVRWTGMGGSGLVNLAFGEWLCPWPGAVSVWYLCLDATPACCGLLALRACAAVTTSPVRYVPSLMTVLCDIDAFCPRCHARQTHGRNNTNVR